MSFHFSRAKESNHTNLFKHCYGHSFGHNLSPRKNGFRWKSMEILCWQNSTNQDKNTHIRIEDLCETLGRQDGTRDLTTVETPVIFWLLEPNHNSRNREKLVLWTYRIRVFFFSFGVGGSKKFKFSFQFLGLVGLICLINWISWGRKLFFFSKHHPPSQSKEYFRAGFSVRGKFMLKMGKLRNLRNSLPLRALLLST